MYVLCKMDICRLIYVKFLLNINYVEYTIVLT